MTEGLDRKTATARGAGDRWMPRQHGDTASVPICFVVDDEPSMRALPVADPARRRHRHRGIRRRRELPQGDGRDDRRTWSSSMSVLSSPTASNPSSRSASAATSNSCSSMSNRGSAVLEHVKSIGEQHELQMLPVLKKPFDTSAIIAIMQRAQARPCRAAGGTGRTRARRSRTDGSSSGTSRRSTCARSSSPASRRFARCRHPQFGILLPGAFMPGATEHDLTSLSELAISSVLKAAQRLAKLGINMRFAVNVPVSALVKLSIPDLVRAHRDADRAMGRADHRRHRRADRHRPGAGHRVDQEARAM